MKKINSLSNPLVHHLIKLRQDKIYRADHHSCLIMGNKIVTEVSKKHKPIKVITTDNTFYKGDENSFLVTPEIMKKITGLPSPESLAAEVPQPKEKKLDSEKFLLVLDRIRDPGNIGTIIRTAHGLGWEGIIFTPESCDPFNDKALRSAKGSTFFISLFQKSISQIEELIEQKNYTPYLADAKGKDLSAFTFKAPLLLILSSESHGSSPWSKNLTNKIAIPLKEDIDSLNVAISGGILMYEIIKRVL
jgi:RNA methyltransferase, TrmH family